MTILRWIFALAVGGFLIFFGILKFTGEAHIFPYIEYKAAGLPLADLAYPLGNYATGGLEILAGALLILPMTRKLGAMLSVLPFAGAVGFHLSPWLGTVTPDAFADPKPVEALAAGGPFLAEHFSQAQSTGLFTIAAVMLAISIVNLFIQKSA